MNPDVLAFAQVAVIVVLLAGSLTAVTIGLVRGVQRKPRQLEGSSAQNLQLEQLQQSVDAIAVEVERIAEAQRFSAKLLAERGEPRGLIVQSLHDADPRTSHEQCGWEGSEKSKQTSELHATNHALGSSTPPLRCAARARNPESCPA